MKTTGRKRTPDADPWQSLGTRGTHIEIVDYHADWPRVFEREAATILEVCQPWVTDVHHIGSTSVPGLAAKPVLDIMPIAGGPAEGLEAVSRMTELGYRYRGENGIPGRFYFDRVVDGRTVAHVHMLPVGHPDAGKHLAFRDYLRNHPEAARDYERLKRELASKYRNDRRTYTDSKAEFTSGIIATAIRAAGSNYAPTRHTAAQDAGRDLSVIKNRR